MKIVKEYKTDAVLLDMHEEVFTAKSGKEAHIVMLVTDQGRFTAHDTVWARQHIDDIEPGTHLEITYTTFTKDERTFKNFKRIKILED